MKPRKAGNAKGAPSRLACVASVSVGVLSVFGFLTARKLGRERKKRQFPRKTNKTPRKRILHRVLLAGTPRYLCKETTARLAKGGRRDVSHTTTQERYS